MNNNLTTGKIAPTLLKFAFPYLLANALQAVYSAVDLIIIGQFSSPETTSAAVAGVAIGSQIMMVFTVIVLGISTGATILIAKYTGADNKEKLAQTIGCIALIFAVMAIILTPLLIALNSPAISLMQTPSEAVGYTKDFLLICSFGLPFIIGYNAVSGIFRGMGDSKTPLVFVGIACTINILLNLLFVAVLHLGPKGSALSTIIAQGLAFLLSISYMKIKGFSFEIKRKHFRLDKSITGKVFRVGVPLALQDALVSLSFLIITAIVNTMGVTETAAVGVVGRLLGFLFIPQTAFAAAISTISSQNIGAGKPERSFKSLYYGIGFSVIYSIIMFVYSQINPESLVSIFTSDINVIKGGAIYLKSFSYDYVLVSFVFSFNTFFSSFNKAVFSMAHSLIATFLIRIPVSFAVVNIMNGSLYEMGFAAPVSTSFSFLACLCFFFYLRKKLLVVSK